MKVEEACWHKTCYIEAWIEINAGSTDVFYVENKTKKFEGHPLELKGMKS